MNIPLHRLHNQQISSHRLTRPDELIAWLGAMQAQNFPGAKWSIGLRLPEATEAGVTAAIDTGTIIRTWPLRGTLHFVAAKDVHWMRELLAPGIIARSVRRHEELELDTATFARCEKLLLKALQGGKRLTREATLALLIKAGISCAGQRGYHILWRMAQEGLLCFGPHEGKQATFVLLDEWRPPTKPRARDESLADLARRYFNSHGPATLEDFVNWSGLKIVEARTALDSIASSLTRESIAEKTYWLPQNLPSPASSSSSAYLLPGFDEYMLGYRDRSDTLAPQYAQRICPGSNGMFIPTIILNGRVAGTWKRTLKKTTASLSLIPFVPLKKLEKQAIVPAFSRYAAFMNKNPLLNPS